MATNDQPLESETKADMGWWYFTMHIITENDLLRPCQLMVKALILGSRQRRSHGAFVPNFVIYSFFAAHWGEHIGALSGHWWPQSRGGDWAPVWWHPRDKRTQWEPGKKAGPALPRQWYLISSKLPDCNIGSSATGDTRGGYCCCHLVTVYLRLQFSHSLQSHKKHISEHILQKWEHYSVWDW